VKLIAPALLVLALAAAAPGASASTSHACGRIDINYPHGAGGASAIKIRAVKIGCPRARPIVRACMRGHLTRGWHVRTVADRTVYREHVLLTSGKRRITYHPAGGGGCGR
jgi:hypothetical protein